MKKAKYLIFTDTGIFESNSRNARKHLAERETELVHVCTNSEEPELICMAKRVLPNLIVVGTVK